MKQQYKLKKSIKNQARFRLGLRGIKTGGKKSVDQKNAIKNIIIFFYLPKENIDFFRDYSFCYLKPNTKQNMEKDIKF